MIYYETKDVVRKADIRDMATKTDIAELEARPIEKIAESKHTMIVWMIGIGLSVLIGNAMIMMTLFLD